MSDRPVFEVLHLDDQPELVAWIPRAISTWFWKHYTESMSALPLEDEEDETERCFNLHLRARDENFDTRYRILTDPGELLSSLSDQSIGRTALVFLDQAIGENSSAGSDTYRQIEQQFPALLPRIFILSAYPNLVLAQLGWSDTEPRLIVKPAAQEGLIAHFVTNLVGIASIGQDTRSEMLSKIRQ